jgi:hypothetical protein
MLTREFETKRHASRLRPIVRHRSKLGTCRASLQTTTSFHSHTTALVTSAPIPRLFVPILPLLVIPPMMLR